MNDKMMQVLDGYILGNGTLHAQLALATKILAMLAARTPHCLTLEAFAGQTLQPARELRKLCDSLCRAELVQQTSRDSWTLTCTPGSTTLEDVYRAILAAPGRKAAASTAAPHDNLELLLAQAAMAINQNIFTQLRQFTLDRLMNTAAASASSAPAAQYSTSYVRSRHSATRTLPAFH
ncbi:MAG: Rrf2 family transcriptional regulator [bacterium]|nr:Rrf2 family transcriptional regulator [bacterium]